MCAACRQFGQFDYSQTAGYPEVQPGGAPYPAQSYPPSQAEPSAYGGSIFTPAPQSFKEYSSTGDSLDDEPPLMEGRATLSSPEF